MPFLADFINLKSKIFSPLMNLNFKTVIKLIIVLVLIVIIVSSVISSNIEELPDEKTSVKNPDQTPTETKEFEILYFRDQNYGNVQRFTFNGSYEFDDFDSSSIDVNDEIRRQDTNNTNKDMNNRTNKYNYLNKNYEAEDFEESTTTNKFFIQNDTVDYPSLSNKIDNLRRELEEFNQLDYKCLLQIDRDRLLEDSKTKILCLPVKYLKVTLQIKFKDEHGFDLGGVKKEWFNLLLKKILNPDLGYFCTSQDGLNTLRPSVDGKSKSNYKYFYRFVGRIIGMAILQDCKVTTNFDKMVYKFLLKKEFQFIDLQAVDPSLYNGLNYFLENNIDEEEFNFVHPYKKDGNNIEKDLIPKGSKILATEKNKKSYIKLKTEMILFRLIQDQLNAMKKGLYDILEPFNLIDFTESEFELLLCGISDIDIDDWKRHTYYIGYSSDSEIILWFWTAVDEFTLEQRKKLLQFVTGSDKVPYGGFANLRSDNRSMNFNIAKSIKSSIYLPDAHTCFNRIDIPEYISYDNLKEKLLKAISEGSEGITET